MEKGQLSVREIQQDDVSKIADYWFTSSPEFLQDMGVDVTKMPSREDFTSMIEKQLELPLAEKGSYGVVWLMDGEPVGHCNVNPVKYGDSAFMHLHLWHAAGRQRGAGVTFVRMSLPYFFDNLKLDVLYSQPYVLNPAPNKTLARAGFTLEQSLVTTPGSINFEQEVNRWVLTREAYAKLR